MALALLLARLALAIVFLVAGLAKLADRAGSRQAMLGFGVPVVLAGPFGLFLPIAEIATAIALIPRGSARVGAVAALTLVLLFCLGIAISLARGEAPDCHCFGQLHSAPAGWSTLGRNVVLALIAAFVVWRGWSDPGRGAVDWIGNVSAAATVGIVAGLAILALLAGEGWLLLNLTQQNGRLLTRIEALELGGGVAPPDNNSHSAAGLPIGSTAPGFQLPGLFGERLTLDALRSAGRPVVLVFSDPHCGPCNALMPQLGRWQHEEGGKLTLAVISRGSEADNRAKGSEHGLTRVLLQQDREVAEAFKSHGTPAAVVVLPNGTIGSALSQGAEQIRGLVERLITGQPLAPVIPPPRDGQRAPLPVRLPAPTIGARAPAINLRDLDGNPVDLASGRGHETLVVFWNPSCGFCQRMRPELLAWEQQLQPTAPRLLVVSTGPAEMNRAQGFRSTLVLDEGFGVGRAFGASGTPSAVLVDAQGRIASEVAVGAPSVMALAEGNPAGAGRG